MERLIAKMPSAALVIYFAHSVTYGLTCSIQLTSLGSYPISLWSIDMCPSLSVCPALKQSRKSIPQLACRVYGLFAVVSAKFYEFYESLALLLPPIDFLFYINWLELSASTLTSMFHMIFGNRYTTMSRNEVKRNRKPPAMPNWVDVPPINIHVLLMSSQRPVVSQADDEATRQKPVRNDSIGIPGRINVAVEEYTNWHLSRVSTEMFKENIRKAQDVWPHRSGLFCQRCKDWCCAQVC